MRNIFFLLIFVFPLNMAAQVLSETVSDKRTDEPLLSATVGISGADGKMQYTATDMKGIFEFKNIKSGDYTLQISYVGYKTYTKNISVPQSGASIEIFMEEGVQSIGQVSVEARATRAQQKGDSLVYNAEAFKVMQGSTAEDLAGVMSSSQGGGRGSGGGGNSANNFMVGNLGGVTSSNGLGFNYVDQWSDKLKFTGSYFFNQSVNNKETNTDRQYFESVLPGLSYSEYNNSRMENWNHRINMKLDYQIDKNNSLQIKPNISFQNNDMTGFMQGINMNNSVAENEIQNTTGSNTNAYNIGTDVIFRHRFPVEGRTLSVMFNGKVSNKTGKTYNDYLDILYGATTTEDSYGQLKDINEKQYSLRGNVMFTEKLSDILQLQTSYKVSYSDTESDRKVFFFSFNHGFAGSCR